MANSSSAKMYYCSNTNSGINTMFKKKSHLVVAAVLAVVVMIPSYYLASSPTSMNSTSSSRYHKIQLWKNLFLIL